jgi:tetratricopeptide (TPR) repeat protein
MHTPNLILSTCLVALTACAEMPTAQSGTPREAAASQAAAAPPPVVTSGLTEPVLYSLLLGEIAAQRGEPVLAAEAYADLALKTRDARVVKRAVDLAVKARKMELATRLAVLWVELEPESYKARQVVVPLLVGEGRYRDAQPHLKALLGMKERPPSMNFLHMQALLGRPKDKSASLDLIKEIAAAYPTLPEAHYAVAQAAWQADQVDQATKSLDEALRLKPVWEAAALFRGQIYQRQSEPALLAYWQAYLQRNPDAAEVRMAYAKALAKSGQYREARAEFSTLTSKSGNNAEVSYAIALLSMQINDFESAETYLQAALKQGYPDQSILRLYLAQVSEGRQRYDEALSRYDEVDGAERALEARLKAVVLLGKLKRVAEAKLRLDSLKPDNDRERIDIVQAEAQMLREAGDPAGAFAVLDKALRAMPDATELLYDRAMAAEKINRLDVLEADLRRLIELDPDHAHAYNALGYTLADRTPRLDEAIKLIEKALKLAPDDAFILDSMGWAMFKAKRYEESETYLRRAYGNRPDVEIAAHLGEVLWSRGRQDEASKVWSEAARLSPDNEVLRETQKRLKR